MAEQVCEDPCREVFDCLNIDGLGGLVAGNVCCLFSRSFSTIYL
jgi:hypothetical protein